MAVWSWQIFILVLAWAMRAATGAAAALEKQQHSKQSTEPDVVTINLGKTAASYKGTAVWDSSYISLKSKSGQTFCEQKLQDATTCDLVLGKDVLPGKSQFLISIYSRGWSKPQQVHFSQWLQFDIDDVADANDESAVDALRRVAAKTGSRLHALGRGVGTGLSDKVFAPLGRAGKLVGQRARRLGQSASERLASVKNKKQLLQQGGVVGAGVVAVVWGGSGVARALGKARTASAASAAARFVSKQQLQQLQQQQQQRGNSGTTGSLLMALGGLAVAAIVAGTKTAAAGAAAAGAAVATGRRSKCWWMQQLLEFFRDREART